MGLHVFHPSEDPSFDEVLASLRPAVLPESRPYVIANFIVTVDGSTSIAGESGTIGQHAPGDSVLFKALRESVDAVLAGTSTIEHEGYRRLVRGEDGRARRAAAGLTPDPLAVVMSRSGHIPDGVPMLDDPAQPRRFFTGDDADPAHALRALREEDGIELLLCEGGPTLLGDLVRRGLVDELFLTISPVLAGGKPERTLLGGDPDHARTLELVGLVKAGSGLHARYAMLATGDASPTEPSPGAHQSQ